MHSEDSKIDLAINELTKAQYEKLQLSGLIKSGEMYFITDDKLNAEGKQIENVADPELSSDAANKNYVDSEISSIPLSDYYTQSQTSSSVEISSAISQKSQVNIVVWED